MQKWERRILAWIQAIEKKTPTHTYNENRLQKWILLLKKDRSLSFTMHCCLVQWTSSKALVSLMKFPLLHKRKKWFWFHCVKQCKHSLHRSTQTRATILMGTLYDGPYIGFTTTTLQTIRVASAQLVDRFHRYDCFSFVFFTSIDNESRFGVFVPSRQSIFYFSCTISIDTVYVFFIMNLLCSLVRSSLQVLTFSFNGFQQ